MTELHLIGLKLGEKARALEKRLIDYARHTYPHLCCNKVPDARGLRRDDDVPIFIYVAVRFDLLRLILIC